MSRDIITEETMKRYEIMQQVHEKMITLTQASILLGVCYRQSKRLYARYKFLGLEGLVKHYGRRPSRRKVTSIQEQEIVKLRQDLYMEFNILHFLDKLKEIHGISMSYETLRKILVKHNLHRPRKRRKVYRRRRRMPKKGMLIQMDSSQHQWLSHIKEKWWLIAVIDDASNEVPYAFFTTSDTTFANMHVIRVLLEKKGLFEALYVDKASHFITTRRGGFNQDIVEEQDNTNIAQALTELGIVIIPAHSPQAKGRVERLFRFLQDRLINEMKLAGIKDYEQANRFLNDKFLPYYNAKYTHDVPSNFRSLPKATDLDLVFTCRIWRKVKNDNTISVWAKDIQLPMMSTWRTLARSTVEIRFNDLGDMWILFKSKIILRRKRFITKSQMKGLLEEEYLSRKIIA